VFERGKDSVVEFAKENMGYVVKNSYLKQACLHKNVQYIQGSWTSLTQDENFVYLQTPQISIQAKILIAADGKYSQIAKHSQIGLFNYSYGQSALVFNITHTLPHKNIAIEEFVSNGPLALLPLEDGFSSGVVWTLDKSLADYVFALYKSGEARFLEIFKNELQRMRHIGDFINIAGDVSLYPLSFSFAKKRYKGRILLIGDSYHHIHPVAGQGFNMTIKDAISLRKMGENSLKLGLDIGNFANLETFERECMLEHGLMSLATDGIVRLFSSSNPLLRFTRNFGLATFNQISYLKNITIKQASGERFVKNNF
jgi:2-octaprenyl-6-methoxyphenol hydroxylase